MSGPSTCEDTNPGRPGPSVPIRERKGLGRNWGAPALAYGLPVTALGLWLTAMPHVSLDRISDYGLITALPVTYFVALAVLAVSFYLQLGRSRFGAVVPAVHVLLLIVMVHGVSAFLYDVPRFSWTYKHVGVTQYILEHRSVDPLIDAYHNWPGFFALAAVLTKSLGLSSPLAFAGYSQLSFNLLYLPLLLVLFRTLTVDRRVVWHAVWLFYSTSWVSQDYFAPQALAYLFHLAILGLCFGWLSGRSVLTAATHRTLPVDGDTGPEPAASGQQPTSSVVLGTVVALLLFAAVVCSHQLTPFMTIAAVTALVLTRVCRVRSLPVIMLGMVLLWNSTMASPYMAGHNQWYSTLGSLLTNLDKNLPDLQGSSAAHQFVVNSTRVMTLCVWLMAAIGAFRMRRGAGLPVSVVLVAFAPFPLLALQSYGGEMLLRIYFFSLPFMVFLGAHVLTVPSPNPPQRSSVASALLAHVGLLGLMLVAYFGNEKINHISRAEVSAAQWVYTHAPKGSTILTVASINFPQKVAANYNDYTYISLTDDHNIQLRSTTVSGILNYALKTKTERMYVIFSKGQHDYTELYRKISVGTYNSLKAGVINSPRFAPVYINDHTAIYALR